MEEVNQLLDIANQMGLVDGLFKQTVPNSTKCATWHDIEASHMSKDSKKVLSFDDIFGMMILLFIGISSALLVSMAEKIIIWKRLVLIFKLYQTTEHRNE